MKPEQMNFPRPFSVLEAERKTPSLTVAEFTPVEPTRFDRFMGWVLRKTIFRGLPL